MSILNATVCMKGGVGSPPPPPPPPSPTSAADVAARNYRERQNKRAVGFRQTILGGFEQGQEQRKTILGG